VRVAEIPPGAGCLSYVAVVQGWRAVRWETMLGVWRI
jgi:hypothetical protein